MLKDMDFGHSEEIYLTIMENKDWMLLTKIGLDTLKTASKKSSP